MSIDKTQVNYDAVNLNPNQDSGNPMDDAMAFKSLLQAVHGEFNETVNKNITSSSSTLQPLNGKTILEKGINEIVHNRKTQQIGGIPNFSHNVATTPQTTASLPEPPTPQPISQPIIENQQPQPEIGPGQLEFQFDNSTTARQIFDFLEVINNKLDTIIKKIEPQPKKRRYTKTSTTSS